MQKLLGTIVLGGVSVFLLMNAPELLVGLFICVVVGLLARGMISDFAK